MSDLPPLPPLTGRTTVVGVIGWPVKHSLSPPMHNAAFAALGLDWVYVPFEVAPEAVAEALAGMRALGIRGLNVTIPHKAAVAGLVDERDDMAAALEAVNTVHNRDGRLVGYNTDGPGFLRSLQEAGHGVRGKSVALIGAGGSARSVAYAVAREGAASLSIVARKIAQARDLADMVRRRVGREQVMAAGLELPEAQARVHEADIVVDSTPVGMHPHAEVAPVVPASWLREGQVVCDLTYNPLETTLLRAARSRGAQTVAGTGMLVHQGAVAFEIWTGQPAPVSVMREALLNSLAAQKVTAAAVAK
jgi:shikimate dehydrogenase